MHVRKLPSGRWRWIVQHHGQKRSGTADSIGAARLAGSQALVELGADQPHKIGRATVEDLLAAWQADGADHWSPTYAADVHHVCTHLPATFLNRNLNSVTPAVIAQLQRTLIKQGWSPHRLQRLRGCLSGAWVMAITYGWASKNPVRDVRAPHVAQSDVHAPDHDIVRTILDTAPPKLRLFLRLAAVTGARRGELLALQWRDLDRDGTLAIRRAVVQVAGSAPVVRDTTKTGRKGDRRLALDDGTLAMLEAHRAAQADHAERVGEPAVFIFSHDAGVSPWRPDYVGLAYRRHRDTIPGAESVRLHDLRHYVATTMLLDGEAPIDVAAQLGHSTPATTLRVYASYLPGRGRDSATRRAQRLSPG